MAKQRIVVASIIFFAAVWMQAATAQDPNTPVTAANIAPAAAAGGLNADEVMASLQAAKDGAPVGAVPDGVLRQLGPSAAGQPNKDSSGTAATASAGAVAAAGVVGSVFFF